MAVSLCKYLRCRPFSQTEVRYLTDASTGTKRLLLIRLIQVGTDKVGKEMEEGDPSLKRAVRVFLRAQISRNPI